MELREPRFRYFFENYVLSLQNPKTKILTREFLDEFLKLLIPGITINKSAPHDFPVSLASVASLYEIPPSKFLRLITGRRDRKEKTEFTENVDYTVKNDKIWMTHSCFARASMKLRKFRGGQVRQYFELVDRGLRDIMGSSLTTRLKDNLTEAPSHHPYFTGGSQGTAGNYDFAWTWKNHRFRYQGITDDFNTRAQTHLALKGGDISDEHWKNDPYPQLKERCIGRYYADHKIAVPDYMRGFEDLYDDDSVRYPEVRQFCDDLIKKADQEWANKYGGYTESTETGIILPHPSMYPQTKEKSRPRTRAHSWLQAPVVHYDDKFQPSLLKRGPKFQNEKLNGNLNLTKETLEHMYALPKHIAKQIALETKIIFFQQNE